MNDDTLFRWRFFRAGGFDQVRLDSGADILALDGLDQKLWVVLSCPVAGLEFDRRTLDLLDSDKDGRIRVGEILEAIAWLRRVLKDPEILVAPGDDLPLAAIAGDTPEGARVLASARRILANLGKPDAEAIGPADTENTEAIFAKTHFNGDGIVPPEAAGDEATGQVIRDIIACLGPEADRSGLAGVSQAKADQFFAEAEAFLAWHGRAPADPSVTAAALGAVDAVRAKIEDYFLRCRLAAFDARTAEALGPAPDTLANLDALPLAAPAAGRPLPLGEGLNPAFETAMETFRAAAAGDRSSLSEADWKDLLARLEPGRAWLAEKPATVVESLGAQRLREILEGGAKAKVDALLAEDKALEPEAAAIGEVDKLVRFRRDLHGLLNNFVSFRDFYTRRGKAVFQAGTLFLDGRSCDLCLKVEDPAKHAGLATLSRIYLVYCACTRPGSGETMNIAAAVTAGDSDQLTVGRNGIFYDRQGRDWDATVVKIIEHPISIRQAFWAPYKQLARMAGETVEKIAAAKAKTVQVQVGSALDRTAKAPPPAPAPAAKPEAPAFDAGKFAGIFAAIGLALGAIGTAIASVVTGFLNLAWWQMPLALGGLALVVSGPSIVLAGMKLRQRNLGPILDANGWAVNSRARINIPFGTALTALARLPEGAERSLTDPYAEKSVPWRRYVFLAVVVLAVVLAWRLGALEAVKGMLGR